MMAGEEDSAGLKKKLDDSITIQKLPPHFLSPFSQTEILVKRQV